MIRSPAPRGKALPLYARTLLITGPSEQVASARSGHLEQLRALRSAGRLRVAGELRDGDGYLEIFEARDLLEAQEIAEASPLVSLGLGVWSLREWIELPLDQVPDEVRD